MKCETCGVELGTCCGCCAWDFPEYLGYCEKCYTLSDTYITKMSILNALLDRLDETSIMILHKFVEEYEEDHESLYLHEIVAKMMRAKESKK